MSDRTDYDQELLPAPRRRLLEALEAAGGELSPGELSERTGMPASTRRYHLAALRKAGYVAGPKGLVQLTLAGSLTLARAREMLGPAPGPVALGELIDRWPPVEYRSFIRLGIGQVVARRKLGEHRPRELLGLAAIGTGTGTGKTLAALCIARAVGLSDELALCRLPQPAAGELLGRIEFVDGRRRFVPASRLARPLVILNEWDKAAKERREAALACLDNGYHFEREGELFEQQAVPVLTANKDHPLPEYARRRAIVLDTDPAEARGELAGIATLAGELDRLYRAGRFPTLAVDQLTIPVLALPDAERELLAELLSRSLTAERMRLTNPGAAELLVLAYQALIRGSPMRMAVAWAVSDYLVVSETTGGTREGWQTAHFRALGPVVAGRALEPLQVALERRQQQQRQLEAGRERRQLERTVGFDALAESRGVLAQQLKEMIDRLHLGRLRDAPSTARAEAKGLAEVLRKLRDEALEARSEETLDGVRERARDPLQRAVELLQHASAERESKERLRKQLKDGGTIGNVPKAFRAQAKAIRGDLDKLLTQIPTTHGDELQALERAAERALTAARELPVEIERERIARERDADARRNVERLQQKAAQRQAQSAREAAQRQAQAARSALRSVRQQIGYLERLARRTTTRSGEGPLETLGYIGLDGQPLLAYQAEEGQASRGIGGFLQAIAGVDAEGGWWFTPYDQRIRFYGDRSSCAELAHWQSPGTQQVLGAALNTLRAREAQLAARLPRGQPRARKPRKRATPRPRPQAKTPSRPRADPSRRDVNTAMRELGDVWRNVE